MRDVKQGSQIKTKKVIIDDEEVLNKLKELCGNIKNENKYNFNFITKENHETYLVCCDGCHHNYHLIQTDDEHEETIGITYNEIFVINYEKLKE